jgi:hypothetical protein
MFLSTFLARGHLAALAPGTNDIGILRDTERDVLSEIAMDCKAFALDFGDFPRDLAGPFDGKEKGRESHSQTQRGDEGE